MFLVNEYTILLTKATIHFHIRMHWKTVIDLVKNSALQIERKKSFGVIYPSEMMNEWVSEWMINKMHA